MVGWWAWPSRLRMHMHKSKFHGAFVLNRRVEPSTRCLLDGPSASPGRESNHKSGRERRPRARRRARRGGAGSGAANFMLDEPGNLMMGVEVPTARRRRRRARGRGGPALRGPTTIGPRPGRSRRWRSAPRPDLVREGVRIRLHAFSASNARNELANAAQRLGGAAGGGLMVPCVGARPGALRPGDGVESERARSVFGAGRLFCQWRDRARRRADLRARRSRRAWGCCGGVPRRRSVVVNVVVHTSRQMRRPRGCEF